MAIELDGRDSTGREFVRALLHGASLEDLAWASGRDTDEVMSLVHKAVAPPEAPGGVGPEGRRRIADYLLFRQSPGQAAGTWELLQSSPAALAWASASRQHLADLYASDPPQLPDEEAGAPLPAGTRRSREQSRQGPVGRRRAERRRVRTQAQIQTAVALETSPFREEAVRKLGEREDEIKLPHYASRPVRLALYGVVVALGTVLLLCIVVSIPVYTTAKVLVVDLQETAPGDERGPSMVALFPSETLDSVEEGRMLRVQLPDTEERVSVEITYVEDEVRGPQEIAERYGLPELQANRVLEPHVVAVAALETPDGAPSRDSFEGVVTVEAEARTGSEQIIGLIF